MDLHYFLPDVSYKLKRFILHFINGNDPPTCILIAISSLYLPFVYELNDIALSTKLLIMKCP